MEALSVRWGLLRNSPNSEFAKAYLTEHGYSVNDKSHFLVHSVENLGEYCYLNTLLTRDGSVADHQRHYSDSRDAAVKLNRTLREYLGICHSDEFTSEAPHTVVTYHQGIARVFDVSRDIGLDIRMVLPRRC